MQPVYCNYSYSDKRTTDLQSYPVKVDESTGDILVSLQIKPGGEGETTIQPGRIKEKEDSDASEKKFYNAECRSMLKAMKELLQKELQIPKERLRIEGFTGY